jgi:hypothetical protein
MSIEHAFLFITALGLHAGFGVILGTLVLQLLRRGYSGQMLLLTTGFGLLIYLPSSLVISSLAGLSTALRALILLIGIIPLTFPLLLRHGSFGFIDSVIFRKTYPAICMCLLAIWGLLTFYLDGELSGVFLTFTSILAAMAALQKQYQPG